MHVDKNGKLIAKTEAKFFYTKTEKLFDLQKEESEMRLFLVSKRLQGGICNIEIPELQRQINAHKNSKFIGEEIFDFLSTAENWLCLLLSDLFNGTCAKAIEGGNDIVIVTDDNEHVLHIDVDTMLINCFLSKNSNYLASKIKQIKRALIPFATNKDLAMRFNVEKLLKDKRIKR